MNLKYFERFIDLASIETLLIENDAKILLSETKFVVKISTQVDRNSTLRCLYKICVNYSFILATMKKFVEKNSNMTSQIRRFEEEISSQSK